MKQSRSLLVIGSTFLLAVLVGCSTTSKLPNLPTMHESSGPKVSPTVVQADVMRFSDQYATAVAQATDEFRQRVPTAEARTAGQAWKLRQATAAWINAANPNPVVNALDMVVLATLSRMVQEDSWGQTYGESARALLETHRQLERDAWAVVDRYLKPDQQQELRTIIADWRAEHPNQRYAVMTSLHEFAEMAGKLPPEGKTRPGSLFSFFMVDPLAGLDPAARAIEQTRYTAERSLYYFQRLPTLLSWQTELLTFELTTTTEAKQLLDDTERLTKTAEQLPAVIDKQREAAIKQVFDNFAVEDEKLRGTLVEFRQALNAGNDMAKSVDATVKSVDKLMARFPQEPTPAPTNSRPFEILDYAKTASEIGAAVKELNTTITSLDQAWPRVQQASETMEKAGTRIVNHAFLLAASLIALLLIGGLVIALVYRRLTGMRSAQE